MFSIFWGIVNIILIKNIDIKDEAVIAAALNEAASKEDLETNASIEETQTPRHIINVMEKIGTLITDGAKSFLAQEYLYLSIFALVFAIILGVTVDAQEMKSN